MWISLGEHKVLALAVGLVKEQANLHSPTQHEIVALSLLSSLQLTSPAPPVSLIFLLTVPG